MAEHYLLLSDPPHREIDPQVAAPLLGWTPAELRMRTHHPAPEIWLAETDREEARRKGQALLQGGLEVCLVRGRDLAAIPVPQPVTALSIGDAGLSLGLDGSTLEIPRDAAVVAAAAQPSREAKERSAKTGGGAASLFVDFYVAAPEGWRAARLAAGAVDLSGLGARKQASFAANVRVILDELRQHFDRAHVDERLKNANYRYALVGGQPMPELLGSISSTLSHLDPFDLASRLVFLTAQRKHRAAA